MINTRFIPRLVAWGETVDGATLLAEFGAAHGQPGLEENRVSLICSSLVTS